MWRWLFLFFHLGFIFLEFVQPNLVKTYTHTYIYTRTHKTYVFTCVVHNWTYVCIKFHNFWFLFSVLWLMIEWSVIWVVGEGVWWCRWWVYVTLSPIEPLYDFWFLWGLGVRLRDVYTFLNDEYTHTVCVWKNMIDWNIRF